jgi:hypothetical protein
VEPKDNVQSLTAKSDYAMKDMMSKFNKSNSEEAAPYLESGLEVFSNYFAQIIDPLKRHIKHPYSTNGDKLFRHKDIIIRCFYPNSVEEIMELLRKEDSPFAK